MTKNYWLDDIIFRAYYALESINREIENAIDREIADRRIAIVEERNRRREVFMND